MPKIAMRTHSARVGREGDEVGAASLETGSPGRGRGAADTGPCGLASATGDAGVALVGVACGSVVMGGFLFLSKIRPPEYFVRS